MCRTLTSPQLGYDRHKCSPAVLDRLSHAADEVKCFALSWRDLFLFYSQLVFVFVHTVFIISSETAGFWEEGGAALGSTGVQD